MTHRRMLTWTIPTAIAIALSGCTSASDTGDDSDSSAEAYPVEPTLAKIKDSGVVRICTTGDYRPFTYLDPDTQEWSGIDIDMGKDLAKRLDAKPEFVQTSWDDFTATMQKDCDIGMGGLSITTDRASELYMSDATVQDGKTPITLCENKSKYDSVKKINDDSVDVITPKGGTNEKFAEDNFPDAHVIKWDDNNTIFDQIIKGDADVMVTDAPETKWVAHTEGELCAVNPSHPLNFSEQGYAVRLGDEEMLQYVNTWLRIVKHDDTYATAEESWFG